MTDLKSTFSWVVLVLLVVWFLYLAYKIAEHVGAWPFG